MRFGQIQPYLLHLWFSFGVLVGSLLMVTSVVVLSLTLYKAFSRDAPEQVLTPVVGIKVKCWLNLQKIYDHEVIFSVVCD